MLRSAILPTLLALILHGAVLGLLLHSWDSPPPEVSSVEPLYIAVRVVNVAPLSARAGTSKPKPLVQVSKPVPQSSQIPEPSVREEELVQAPSIVPSEEPEGGPMTNAVSEDEVLNEPEVDEALLGADLMRAIAAEEGARAAVTDDEQVMAYIGQIQRDIAKNWSRPPSARNGMQAILRVFLVPTGELVDVQIAESSGNTAFDRSAMVAVEKVSRFSVPDQPALFEKSFREFTLLFRPEDLRL